MPIDAPPTSRAPADRGFGKVLSSIQGLQERLDDISLDEISRAHMNASALIDRLHDCQRRLDALAKLKEAITRVTLQIAALPDESKNSTGVDGLQDYSQLRALVRVGKLIQMRRSLQDTSASTDRSLFKSQGIASFPSSSADEMGDETTSVGSPPPLQPEHGTEGDVKQEMPSAVEAQSSETRDGDVRAVIALETALTPQEPQSTHNPLFDQRLLNELIDTYGEFTMATASKPSESQTMIPAEIGGLPEVRAERTLLQATPAEPAFVHSTVKKPLALPASRNTSGEATRPQQRPKIKKNRELDRELKNIIRDYGEYDLYSPPKSMDIKMVALAAFVFLSLLIVGLYLW